MCEIIIIIIIIIIDADSKGPRPGGSALATLGAPQFSGLSTARSYLESASNLYIDADSMLGAPQFPGPSVFYCT